MKKYIMFAGLLMILASSCIKDDSVGMVNDISTIMISVPREELSVKFGFELEYTPEVSQSFPDKELSYEWAARPVDSTRLEVISREKVLKYRFTTMGKYYLRLKVFNEDGAAFQEFTVNVDAAFEEGILMLSVDENGEGNVGFVRKLTAEEKDAGFQEEMLEHCFTTVNPGFSMKEAVDIDKNLIDYNSTNGYLYISLRDRIYVAHSRTFEWLYTVTLEEEAPTFRIKKMVSADDYYATIPLIYSEDGTVRALNPKGLFLYENTKYGVGPYEDVYDEYYFSGSYRVSQGYFVDYSTSTLWGYTGQGPFTVGDMFKGEDIQTLVRMNGTKATGHLFVLSTSLTDPDSVYVRRLDASLKLLSKFAYKSSSLTVKRGMDLVPNMTYNSVYYFKGSKIYVWYPQAGTPSLPTSSVIDLAGLGGKKEVGCLNISNDGKELYVGYYDSDEKRGGLYIYDATKIGIEQNLKPVRRFEKKAGRPIRVLYKSR